MVQDEAEVANFKQSIPDPRCVNCAADRSVASAGEERPRPLAAEPRTEISPTLRPASSYQGAEGPSRRVVGQTKERTAMRSAERVKPTHASGGVTGEMDEEAVHERLSVRVGQGGGGEGEKGREEKRETKECGEQSSDKRRMSAAKTNCPSHQGRSRLAWRKVSSYPRTLVAPVVEIRRSARLHNQITASNQSRRSTHKGHLPIQVGGNLTRTVRK